MNYSGSALVVILSDVSRQRPIAPRDGDRAPSPSRNIVCRTIRALHVAYELDLRGAVDNSSLGVSEG